MQVGGGGDHDPTGDLLRLEPLIPSNAQRILEGYDLILDCTDNAPTRYLLNDTAVILGNPLLVGRL